MSNSKTRDLTAILGFAIGVGIGTAALLGTYFRFAYAGVSGWILYPATFLGGAVLGGAWGWWRGN